MVREPWLSPTRTAGGLLLLLSGLNDTRGRAERLRRAVIGPDDPAPAPPAGPRLVMLPPPPPLPLGNAKGPALGVGDRSASGSKLAEAAAEPGAAVDVKWMEACPPCCCEPEEWWEGLAWKRS